MEISKEKIEDALREVYDPEIPMNVYDLGLIYEININGDEVGIVMTLTSPTCPTGDFIKTMVGDAVETVEGVKKVEVEITFEPMWSPDKVSSEAKEELGIGDDIEGAKVNKIVSEEVDLSEICFNCGKGDGEGLIIPCKYKGENTFVCGKCAPKF